MVTSTDWPGHFIIALLLIISSTVVHATATARVDRTVLTVDESLTLTLSTDKTGAIGAPELSGIRTNFHIIGNNQSSRHSFVNGRSESVTQWQLTLIPKQTGQLLIPAIYIDGEATSPIEIEVRPSAPVSADVIQPIYLESQVDRKQVYVQQQLIYTLRVFHSVQLDNMNVSEPAFDQATVKKLSQNSFQRRINNIPYRVHELRYAIFAQQSGELIIPETVFTANEAVSHRSFFSVPAQGKALRRMSQQHTITVLDVPSDFTGATWLPAKSLELVESWSADLDNLRVGDSITRRITTKAEGLLDSQLPPVQLQATEGVKLYPDKAQTQSTETSQGVTASRTDSTALIPTREGPLTLPPIHLSWWDTKSNTMREAHIPGVTLTIKPALEDTGQLTPVPMDHSKITSTASVPVATVTAANTIYWQIACAVFALAWLFTLFLWQSLKRQIAVTKQTASVTPPAPAPLTEKQAFKTLSRICHDNAVQEARQAIINWAQCNWPDANIHSIEDIQQYCQHPPLTNVLLQLNNALYGNRHDSSQWNGESVLAIIKPLRHQKKSNAVTNTPELAPLYPTG